MFIRSIHKFNNLYSPAEVETPISQRLTSGDIESALAEDDSSDPDDKDPDDKDPDDKGELDLSFLEDDKSNDEESEDEEPEEKESEEEEKEFELDTENEDELELAKIPKRQEIKAAYPDIFKKFPALDHIIQREHAFAEVFPSVKDAQLAKESVDQFNSFQSELLSGNVEGVLKAVKSTDGKAFDKIASNFLTSLIKIDPAAHVATTRIVTKGILNQINSLAKNSLKRDPSDKRAQQLEIATELIHDALFNTTEVTPLQDMAQPEEPKEDPEKIKFNKEREEFETSRYKAAFDTVSRKVNNVLTSAVTRDIDPKGILPPYVKSTLIKDIMSECDRQMVQDKRFGEVIKKLWIKARENHYSDSSLENVNTALKEKAKTILPGIMRAKKGEAMRGLTSRKEPSKERELSRTANNGDRTTPTKITATRRDSDRNLPKPGERAIDFLMRD